ncbi:GDP-mannose-dependent alpha-(1-2)-phosphatidylinositol mannosyltransferase [Nocardioides dokdonensis FR1436]|uniref:GDP-mannose-dependent alpha-(1-2)-phosphatidylinositol mannosyltransferase n=1 Tax=Nocardioides dokdonensis FR1436 TaxID=1300347 RepID=A0A1A9GE50_9ACTN|nr:glycosyltransferase [Nocardioides dokdonensis]ANH36557.1 GDP-mannose-dependent alpha-(1-2)-phosphatidylinositol mannosyltransferase [Nocardioides dokdonensis FR1436]
MRIVVVHGRYRSAAPSGENRVVDQETSLLREAGHEVEAFERRSDDIGGWPVARQAMLPLLSVRNAAVRAELVERIRATRADVVHVHNTFPLLSASVLLACRDAGVPVVATVHNYKLLCASGDFYRAGRPCHECADGQVAPGLRHGCYRGSRAATLPVAAGLLVNRRAWQQLVAAYVLISSSQRTLLRGLGLPPDRVFVKPNFVRAPSGPRQPREHLVVHLGRLDEAKGIRLLMQGWERHLAARPGSRLRLVVAGSGPLEPEVRAWGASRPSVSVVGNLDPGAVAALLDRALVAVVPSAWEEVFGLVAIEAMAHGVAPVAPARGSFPELVRDGWDGALFAPGSADDLARVLAGVDRAPEHYLALGARARTTWARRFSPERNLTQLLTIYRFALDHPAGRQPDAPLVHTQVEPGTPLAGEG